MRRACRTSTCRMRIRSIVCCWRSARWKRCGSCRPTPPSRASPPCYRSEDGQSPAATRLDGGTDLPSGAAAKRGVVLAFPPGDFRAHPMRRESNRRERAMGKRYDDILATIGRTPVVRLNKLAPAGVNVFVKTESRNPMGSVKDRLALGVIEDAERRGELKPGQTVIEATSGNTGIGLAMVCAAKGYPLVVTMAENFSVERRKLMRFLGAKVVLTPAAEKGSGMVAKALELAETHGWFLCRQFENEANPDFHSKTTAVEILEDFKGDRLDYWVTGWEPVA